jgi:hypothetical protein
MNIYEKLIEVRKAVPYLKKDNKGHQFQYFSSSQTLGTLKQKMDEMGLLLIPSVTERNVSDHSTKNGGHEYFTEIDITFTWVNAELPEERIHSNWYGQGLDSGEKGVGKALTYAEKYFLLKFFNIATDKDDPDSFQEKFIKPELITENQLADLNTEIKDRGVDVTKFLKFAKVRSLDQITQDKYPGIMTAVQAKEKAA